MCLLTSHILHFSSVKGQPKSYNGASDRTLVESISRITVSPLGGATMVLNYVPLQYICGHVTKRCGAKMGQIRFLRVPGNCCKIQ